MLVARLLPRLVCLQCGLPSCPVPKMSRWARRGQCQGRQARSTSDARQDGGPVFQPVTRVWQERQCRRLRLPFVRTLLLARPRPPPPLRHVEPCMVHEIGGDGNCLFRCLSLVITGSESHHNRVRQRIVSHISENCKAFSPLLPESSDNGNEHSDACARYLSTSKMASGATWGSDVEILAAAHLLRTRIFVYTMHGPDWQWVEHGLELTEPDRKPGKDSIYLMHTGLVHYDLVEDVEQSADAGKDASQDGDTPARHQLRGSGEKASRSRGYSVPCARRAGSQSGSRRRSASRSSRNSNSSSSCSGSSIDSYSSCGESVGSSVSHVNVSRAYSRRRRSGVTSSAPRRGVLPARDPHTHNTNNCWGKNTAKCSNGRASSCLCAHNNNNCWGRNTAKCNERKASSCVCAHNNNSCWLKNAAKRNNRKASQLPSSNTNKHTVQYILSKSAQRAPAAASVNLYKMARRGQDCKDVINNNRKNIELRPGAHQSSGNTHKVGPGSDTCQVAHTTGRPSDRTRSSVPYRQSERKTRRFLGVQ